MTLTAIGATPSTCSRAAHRSESRPPVRRAGPIFPAHPPTPSGAQLDGMIPVPRSRAGPPDEGPLGRLGPRGHGRTRARCDESSRLPAARGRWRQPPKVRRAAASPGWGV